MAAAPSPALDLTPHIAAIEVQLGVLDAALVAQDPLAIESCTQGLHRSLADALAAFRHAGPEALTPELRQRLRLAQARVSGQQSTVRKAALSIERTLGLLLPQEAASTYSALANRAGAMAAGAYRT